MPKARMLRHLTISKLRLFGVSVIVLWLVRLGLWLLPFRSVRFLLSRVKSRHVASPPWAIPARIARAVEVASHLVPRSTCLTKALAGHVLLKRVGHEGVLHIGVARDEAGKFEAHAWLECQGKVIIGGGPRWFVPLSPIGMDG
jgi:hypothetical protein